MILGQLTARGWVIAKIAAFFAVANRIPWTARPIDLFSSLAAALRGAAN